MNIIYDTLNGITEKPAIFAGSIIFLILIVITLAVKAESATVKNKPFGEFYLTGCIVACFLVFTLLTNFFANRISSGWSSWSISVANKEVNVAEQTTSLGLNLKNGLSCDIYLNKEKRESRCVDSDGVVVKSEVNLKKE